MSEILIPVWINSPDERIVRSKSNARRISTKGAVTRFWPDLWVVKEYRHRRQVEAGVVKRNKKSVWVRLEDGNIIKRKVGRDY